MVERDLIKIDTMRLQCPVLIKIECKQFRIKELDVLERIYAIFIFMYILYIRKHMKRRKFIILLKRLEASNKIYEPVQYNLRV